MSNSMGDYGVYGSSPGEYGVFGNSAGYGVGGTGSGGGVKGYSSDGNGGDFTSDNGYGLTATTTNGFYAGVFYGNIYTTGTLYQSSDKNLKTNIQELGDAMSIINKIKPKSYEFKKDTKFASLNLPKGSHYGLLAQDLQEVLPNLVSETPHQLRTVKPIIAIQPTADGKPAQLIPEQKEIIKIKEVNYIELIPILVKGMQELSKENEDLKNQINDLESLILKNGTSSTITSS